MNFIRMKNKKCIAFMILFFLFSVTTSAQYGIFAGSYHAKDSTVTSVIVLGSQGQFEQEYKSPTGRFYSVGSYTVLKDTLFIIRKKLKVKGDANKFFNQKFPLQASDKIWMSQGNLYTFRNQQGMYEAFLILKKQK
jgi:hypothetical protein